MLDVGCWMLDVGCWMLDVGCWMLDVQPGLASFTPCIKTAGRTIALPTRIRKRPQPRPGGHTPNFRMPQPRPGGHTPNFRMPQPRLGGHTPNFRMPQPRLSGHLPNAGMPESPDGRHALSVVEECAKECPKNPAVDRAGNRHTRLAAPHGNPYKCHRPAADRRQIVRRMPSIKNRNPKGAQLP